MSTQSKMHPTNPKIYWCVAVPICPIHNISNPCIFCLSEEVTELIYESREDDLGILFQAADNNVN